MPIEITMPALSPTMTDGTLAKWLKAEGDTVEPGDAIAEIETDKATMEVEAVDEGRLGQILVPAGTERVPVNQPIALLLLPGETEAALSAGSSMTAPETPLAQGDDALAVAATVGTATPPATRAGPAGEAPPSHSDRILASPLARRLAAQAGLDLRTLSGSGPQGRIVKADIEAARHGSSPLAVARSTREPTPAAVPSPTACPPEQAAPVVPAVGTATAPPTAAMDARSLADKLGMVYRAEPHSAMRRTIARRLTEAKQTVPHFYLSIDCFLDEVLKARSTLNQSLPEGVRLSVNDFVIRACALALRKVPAANAAWSEDASLYFEHADISVAVATPAGLITPILKHAETKGLATIGAEMRDLAARARAGKLRPEEFQGGTFTLSNLGMYGVRDFAAIINPPQACLLAVGKGEQRPVVKDGELTVATVLTCTLSVDHRIVDGAVGAEFLAAVKALIEEPLTMLL